MEHAAITSSQYDRSIEINFSDDVFVEDDGVCQKLSLDLENLLTSPATIRRDHVIASCTEADCYQAFIAGYSLVYKNGVPGKYEICSISKLPVRDYIGTRIDLVVRYLTEDVPDDDTLKSSDHFYKFCENPAYLERFQRSVNRDLNRFTERDVKRIYQAFFEEIRCVLRKEDASVCTQEVVDDINEKNDTSMLSSLEYLQDKVIDLLNHENPSVKAIESIDESIQFFQRIATLIDSPGGYLKYIDAYLEGHDDFNILFGALLAFIRKTDFLDLNSEVIRRSLMALVVRFKAISKESLVLGQSHIQEFLYTFRRLDSDVVGAFESFCEMVVFPQAIEGAESLLENNEFVYKVCFGLGGHRKFEWVESFFSPLITHVSENFHLYLEQEVQERAVDFKPRKGGVYNYQKEWEVEKERVIIGQYSKFAQVFNLSSLTSADFSEEYERVKKKHHVFENRQTPIERETLKSLNKMFHFQPDYRNILENFDIEFGRLSCGGIDFMGYEADICFRVKDLSKLKEPYRCYSIINAELDDKSHRNKKNRNAIRDRALDRQGVLVLRFDFETIRSLHIDVLNGEILARHIANDLRELLISEE